MIKGVEYEFKEGPFCIKDHIEGTVSFYISHEQLFDGDSTFNIISQRAGEQVFLLRVTEEKELHFYHYTPSFSTRRATLDLKKLSLSDMYFICFIWSPNSIILNVGDYPKYSQGQLYTEEGKRTYSILRAYEDHLFFFPETSTDIFAGFRFVDNSKVGLESSAIDGFLELRHTALKILNHIIQFDSTIEYDTRIILLNQVLVMLVSSFEVYCKKRIKELELENGAPNIKLYLSQLKRKIKEDQLDIVCINQVNKYCKPNYQNIDDVKLMFLSLYEINIEELFGLDLESFKVLIKYRHRIIHASPSISILNELEASQENKMITTELVDTYIKFLDKYINKLHLKTIERLVSIRQISQKKCVEFK